MRTHGLKKTFICKMYFRKPLEFCVSAPSQVALTRDDLVVLLLVSCFVPQQEDATDLFLKVTLEVLKVLLQDLQRWGRDSCSMKQGRKCQTMGSPQWIFWDGSDGFCELLHPWNISRICSPRAIQSLWV